MDNERNRIQEPESRRTGDSPILPFSPSPHLPTSHSVLDLRGIACPLNFVRTKMQLDKMDFGDILEVLLDSGEAIESVPPSIIEEGHEVLNQEQIEDYFKIIIRKN